MPELTRDALFTALRQRKHYGTTGTRIFIELNGAFDREVTGFSDDPKLGPAKETAVREARMGDIIRPGGATMKLSAEVIGTAPVERVDVLHGTAVVHSVRPFSVGDLGRRVRVLWQGAEYRGRGRETIWQGKLTLTGNRIARFAAVNFLNPERKITETAPGMALTWSSVTTGNLAGVDLWLDQAMTRNAQDRDQCGVGRDRSRDACRQCRGVRRRRAWAEAERLSSARGGLEPARDAGAFGDAPGQRGPAGVYPRHAGGRQPGLDQPDLSDRVSQLGLSSGGCAPPEFVGCYAARADPGLVSVRRTSCL